MLLAGPELGTPADTLQDLVLQRYCRWHACGGESQRHLPPPPAVDGGVWSFAEGRGPAFLTSDGLEFPFPDLQVRGAKRALAESVAEDLRRVAARLRTRSGSAQPVEIAAGPGDRVRVRQGSHPELLVSAPDLRSAPWLWPDGARWAQLRARGRAAHAVLPGVERLLPGQGGWTVSDNRVPGS